MYLFIYILSIIFFWEVFFLSGNLLIIYNWWCLCLKISSKLKWTLRVTYSWSLNHSFMHAFIQSVRLSTRVHFIHVNVSSCTFVKHSIHWRIHRQSCISFSISTDDLAKFIEREKQKQQELDRRIEEVSKTVSKLEAIFNSNIFTVFSERPRIEAVHDDISC